MDGRTPERIVETRDPAGTRALAGALAAAARPGDLISLVGELGAGKTQFAKGFGAGLGVTDTIVSPSFVLMAEYRGRLPLFHIDLYRLAGAAEALAGGLIDERQAEGVTLIEWAERLEDAMPAGRLDVLIEGTGDEPRRIVLRAGTRRLRALPRSRAGGSAAEAASRGRRVEPMTGRPLLAIDTSGTRALVALGSPDGRPDRRAALAGRLSPRRGAADPDRRDAEDKPRRPGRAGRDRRRDRPRGVHRHARGHGYRKGARPRTWRAHRRRADVGGLLSAAGAGVGGEAVLLLPAGPSDRVSSSPEATLVRGGEEPELPAAPSSWPWTCRTARRQAALALGARRRPDCRRRCSRSGRPASPPAATTWPSSCPST